jgi:hypothetical protein
MSALLIGLMIVLGLPMLLIGIGLLIVMRRVRDDMRY